MTRRPNRKKTGNAAKEAQQQRMIQQQLQQAAASDQRQAQAQMAQQARAVARFETYSVQFVTNIYAKLFHSEYVSVISSIVAAQKKAGEPIKINRHDVVDRIDCRTLAEVAGLAAREAMISLEILSEVPPEDQQESSEDLPGAPEADQPPSDEAPAESQTSQSDHRGILLPDGSFSS